jgi:hypothetical protein
MFSALAGGEFRSVRWWVDRVTDIKGLVLAILFTLLWVRLSKKHK